MLNKLMKLKNKKGFTLVELIVVIAIIAILTAIIVPLVGRYSAQARYTTLQDAAATISNSINNGLSDANQIGVINVSEITGQKTNGTLTVTVGTGVSASSTNGVLSAATGTDKARCRAADRICAALAEALPDNSAFYAAIVTSTVSGVIYDNASATVPSGTLTFTPVSGFDNAYENASKAYGISGKYIPAANTSPASAAGAGA